MKNKYIRIIAAILAIIWMAIIFSFSSDTKEQSSEVSISVSYQLVDSTQKLMGLHWDEARIRLTADNIEKAVRKGAHMTEYAILGTLIGIALYVWRPLDITALKPWRRWMKWPALDLLIVLAYAASDEFHQTFVPGREGKVPDVLIDFSGAIICISIITLFVYLHNNRKRQVVS